MSFTEKRLCNPTQLTTSGQTLYTVPAGKTAIIKQLVVTNVTGSSATFSLYIGSAATPNALFSATSVAANDAIVINLSQVLNSTEILTALASANSTLNITISGVENDGPLNPLSTYIADGAITSAKLADSAITATKLALTSGAIKTYSSAADRATQILTPIEGTLTYLQDVDELEVYNGSTWLRVVVTSDDELVNINSPLSATRVVLNETTSSSATLWVETNQSTPLRLNSNNTYTHSLLGNSSTGGRQYAFVTAGTASSEVWARGSFSIVDMNGYEPRLTIDSSGRIQTPNQPGFMARLGTGQTYSYTGAQQLAFNDVAWNVGNHYNSSTGIFTVPVTGRYLISSGLMQYAAPANGFLVIEFYKNGAINYNIATTSSTVDSVEGGVQICAVANLVANDAIQMSSYKSYSGSLGYVGYGGFDWGEARNFFCMHFLG